MKRCRFKLEDLKAQEGFLQKLGTMKGKLPPNISQNYTFIGPLYRAVLFKTCRKGCGIFAHAA